MSVEILSTTTHFYEKVHLKKLTIALNDLEGHRKLSENLASYLISHISLSRWRHLEKIGNCMSKRQFDRSVIPVANAKSRSAELDYVDRRAQNNNLRLNRAKSLLKSYSQTASAQHAEDQPPQIPDIRRVTSIKMLGVTMTNHLSAGEPCPWRHQQVRAVVVRPETVAPARHQRRLV